MENSLLNELYSSLQNGFENVNAVASVAITKNINMEINFFMT
jgi:hypothetical protein